jgi:cyclopropane-fatty-acyl-phospholipid synthase
MRSAKTSEVEFQRRVVPSAQTPAYEVIYRNGTSIMSGEGRPAFTFFVRDLRQFDRVLHGDPYSAAIGFVQGGFDIQGDLVAAIRLKTAASRRGLRYWLATAAAQLAPRRLEAWIQTESRAARNIRFHYDRSNDFYRLFLDSRMVYSCAYFQDPAESIENAQLAKLDHICRKLDLRPCERFLDVGCGWGALAIRAAEKHGALATGCTLSVQQASFGAQAASQAGLGSRVVIQESDYRRLSGSFDKIASVGMFEHVGRRRLRAYFRKINALLEDNGLFLNHGIVRPEGVMDGPETLFLQQRVFPGGELTHLSTVIREAEGAGFEVLDVENLRPHYALTCRSWVERLQQHAAECHSLVDDRTYRTWLLFLAASAFSFENGATDIYQVLLAKRSAAQKRHLTRSYMYA